MQFHGPSLEKIIKKSIFYLNILIKIMKYLIILTALLQCVSFSHAQDNDVKIWMTVLNGKPKDQPERDLWVEKYGRAPMYPGYSFYETYTPRILCAYSDENPKVIKSMIYCGFYDPNFEKFYCKVIKDETTNYYIWFSSDPTKGGAVIAVIEPRKRDYTLEHLGKIDLNTIQDSMKPLADIKPDTKYLGDKILGQFVIKKPIKVHMGEVEIEKITVNTSEETKITHIEMQLRDKSIYRYNFDPQKKVLTQVEDKK